MTKQDILEHFKDINQAYNNSSEFDTLSRMLDELKIDVILCKDCELKEVCITSRGDEWYCGDARQKIDWQKVKGVPAEYEGDARSTWWYVCPECHGAIDPGEHKCRHCGAVILWE